MTLPSVVTSEAKAEVKTRSKAKNTNRKSILSVKILCSFIDKKVGER